ncbi:uncharacterized protein LOC131303800 isoform X2 [Rhododendron vialii]|uniref:uncharacterized protein LOC131303800 isoform X2 n=1 Tax=Rhododendron vialii TaxID=182163 RepID=UPI00265D9126|nr:uncharacterized protein LOC131303800 isoform X2 [Rhododendron vialii]
MFGLASNLRGRDLLPSLYVKIRDVLHVVHGRTTEYYHGKILDGLRSDSLFMSNYPYRRLGQLFELVSHVLRPARISIDRHYGGDNFCSLTSLSKCCFVGLGRLSFDCMYIYSFCNGKW